MQSGGWQGASLSGDPVADGAVSSEVSQNVGFCRSLLWRRSSYSLGSSPASPARGVPDCPSPGSRVGEGEWRWRPHGQDADCPQSDGFHLARPPLHPGHYVLSQPSVSSRCVVAPAFLSKLPMTVHLLTTPLPHLPTPSLQVGSTNPLPFPPSQSVSSETCIIAQCRVPLLYKAK